MRTEGQTSKYLLLASVVSIFSVMLALITSVMVWELWMIPIIVLAMISVWCLHIGRIGSEELYENLCAGVILIEFFFFGVHAGSLYDVPAIVCIMVLVFPCWIERTWCIWRLFVCAGDSVPCFCSAHHHV